MTIPQAARRLNVPESWLRDKVTARKIPHRRLGKHVRFCEEDLDQIAEQARQEPAATQQGRRGGYVRRWAPGAAGPR
ncbi:helix-turn-helix domain-containing protein [Streptomonospora sp. S1-112]|uniref:Helix-turn-helix domain-containing protein n=1 Tax=Streptomonospora mangrovi TaxID=2883123 RepID=A0A9X3NQF1_9ACTN|nr:helix-turn-helix domain-containing protein [Streptomonospora mangrovi]MDA0564845.1 helix-turn-helix domain-containing protein [Streptomonospora mangrovi]